MLIGVIHLPPLLGAPGVGGIGARRNFEPHQVLGEAGELAIEEARTFSRLGFDAVILENFGDAPFYKSQVPPETVASMSVLAAAVREAFPKPVGINILRNDAMSALAVASVTGCDFIRVNVLSGLVASDQGLIEGQAALLLRERARLQSSVAIFADVHVKHARTLSSESLELAIEETAGRAFAEAVIITGATTGRPVGMQDLDRASQAAQQAGVPLYIGSGATTENLEQYRGKASGVIVGSSIREHGQAGAPLDKKRAKDFVRAYRSAKIGSKLSKRKKK